MSGAEPVMSLPSTAPAVRLRQVVLVTDDFEGVTGRITRELGLTDPFVDPGVGEFGLRNNVFAAGDCFVEVLTPIAPGTAAGRYLERRGGEAGYMAIFQVGDLAAARQRVGELGIRIVWQADLGDIAGTHLHPGDVPGAIVSLDWADPPESWHWAGPKWRGGAPADRAGGVTSLTIAAVDPSALALRWADVLGLQVDDATQVVSLAEADQELRFVKVAEVAGEGIVGIGLALPGVVAGERPFDIGGVRFSVAPLASEPPR